MFVGNGTARGVTEGGGGGEEEGGGGIGGGGGGVGSRYVVLFRLIRRVYTTLLCSLTSCMYLHLFVQTFFSPPPWRGLCGGGSLWRGSCFGYAVLSCPGLGRSGHHSEWRMLSRGWGGGGGDHRCESLGIIQDLACVWGREGEKKNTSSHSPIPIRVVRLSINPELPLFAGGWGDGFRAIYE